MARAVMVRVVMVKAVTTASNNTVSLKASNNTVSLKANSSTVNNKTISSKEATNRVVSVYHSLTTQNLTRTGTSTPLLDLASRALPLPTTKAPKINSTAAMALMASVV
jgi:hypothetical protein